MNEATQRQVAEWIRTAETAKNPDEDTQHQADAHAAKIGQLFGPRAAAEHDPTAEGLTLEEARGQWIGDLLGIQIVAEMPIDPTPEDRAEPLPVVGAILKLPSGGPAIFYTTVNDEVVAYSREGVARADVNEDARAPVLEALGLDDMQVTA